MSTHTQQLNHNVSQNEQSLAKSHHEYLKCLHLQNSSSYSKTFEQKLNLLPINLFLSPTEYHKMLITKGKSRKGNHSQIIDGEILSLEYHNDPIFEKQMLNNKYAPTHINKPQLNQSSYQHNTNNTHQNRQASHKLKSSKLSNTNNKKKYFQCQQFSQSLPRKRSHSATLKPKKKNSKVITNSRKTNASFNKNQFKKSMLLDDQNKVYLPKRSKSQKATDISHLIIKSLIDFTENKKAQHQMQTSFKKNNQAKQNYLKQLNEQIRVYNFHNIKRSKSRSKSKSRQKSFTKKELALDYWDHIKDQVLNSLKNDNYSHLLKEHLKNYQFNVYDHKEIPQRKGRYSERQIEMLAVQHEKEVKNMIKYEKRQKRAASQKIKKNLRDLQNERRKKIQQTLKKPFQPTAQMIRSAFQNIVDPNNLQPYRERGESLFCNEKIKISNNSLKRVKN